MGSKASHISTPVNSLTQIGIRIVTDTGWRDGSKSNDLLVMTQLVAVLRHAVRRAARAKPVFYAALTGWPLPVSQASLVSFRITREVSTLRVIPRDAVPSAAASKPTRPANLSSLLITSVVPARVIPRDTLHIASCTVVILVTVQLQLKSYANTTCSEHQGLPQWTIRWPWSDGSYFDVRAFHEVISCVFVFIPDLHAYGNGVLKEEKLLT